MIIEVKNLYYSYDHETDVLKDVSFDIKEGSYTAVIGHNGSGKSTLAKLIAGLLEKKSGSIVINGMELNQDNLPRIRNILAIVFQNPDNQFIGSTVRDDIAFGLENHQVPREKMEEIVLQYIHKVGLDDFKDKEPSNLSGGQKQRVAIAGALAMSPNIIIFDEATSMLDPKGKDDIKKLMYELHKEKSLTILSITHDIEEVLQADDCLVLNQGEIFMHDTPENVFKHSDKLRKIGLEVPFIMQVEEELKKKHIKVDSDDLEGLVKQLCQLRSGH